MVQLIGFEATRITSLFLASFGQKQPYWPKLVSSLVERYHFISYPMRMEDIEQTKVTFRQGVFDGAAIEEFNVYPDGVAAISKSNSDVVDGFLGDLYEWLDQQNVARIKTHKIDKSYDSRLVFRSDVDIPRKLCGAEKVAKMVSAALAKSTDFEAAYQATGFSLSANAFGFPGLKPTDFRIERKTGAPFESDMYYSAAPLPTNEHLKILNTLEAL